MSLKTERKVQQLIKILKQTGGDIKASASALGITRPTVYNWMRKDKRLAQAVDEIRHEVKFEIEDCLYNSAKKGNVTAQIFILTNIWPEKYRHISKIDINKTENELSSLTDAELLKKIASLANELGLPLEEVQKDMQIAQNMIEDIDYIEETDGQG